MSRRSVYEQVEPGEWMDWAQYVDLACCDCGLVHAVETRFTKGKLQLRFARNDRATAQLRRHHKHPATIRGKTKAKRASDS